MYINVIHFKLLVELPSVLSWTKGIRLFFLNKLFNSVSEKLTGMLCNEPGSTWKCKWWDGSNFFFFSSNYWIKFIKNHFVWGGEVFASVLLISKNVDVPQGVAIEHIYRAGSSQKILNWIESSKTCVYSSDEMKVRIASKLIIQSSDVLCY